jgi:FKBP-type peptidyl-prolyl cis-trans isomerase
MFEKTCRTEYDVITHTQILYTQSHRYDTMNRRQRSNENELDNPSSSGSTTGVRRSAKRLKRNDDSPGTARTRTTPTSMTQPSSVTTTKASPVSTTKMTTTTAASTPSITSTSDELRPKSKKELRAEKKAIQRAAAASAGRSTEAGAPGAGGDAVALTAEMAKLEKNRKKQEQRKEFLREQKVLLMKELRMAKKLRKQKRLHRELNAPAKSKAAKAVNEGKALGTAELGGRRVTTTKKETDDDAKQKQQQRTQPDSDGNRDLDIFQKVFLGHTDDSTGVTTLRLGVQYIDVVVGTGKVVQDGRTKEVTVQYKLTGGKFNTVIDRSSRFTFRWGKGEVIQGWEIGLQGMREGGKRKLIVPPKAGYGSQDIGAGAGAVLHFDINLLSC